METTAEIVRLPREGIVPDPTQPRKKFSEPELEELARSMEQNGLLSPINVRICADYPPAQYVIIAGERRWRASGLLGWETIPAIVLDVPELKAKELQLLENINRQDLTPLEEAEGYQAMVNMGYSIEAVAEIVGKRGSDVKKCLDALRCEQEVLDLVENGTINIGVAAILSPLSRASQLRALRYQGRKPFQLYWVTYKDWEVLTERLKAEENQRPMFTWSDLPEEQRSATEKKWLDLCRVMSQARDLTEDLRHEELTALANLFDWGGVNAARQTLADTAQAISYFKGYLGNLARYLQPLPPEEEPTDQEEM